MKKITNLCFCLLSYLCVFANTHEISLKEFQYSILNPEATYNDLVKKYGKPDSSEIMDLDETIYPNVRAEDGSKLYKYFFKDIGEFGFFFRGADKLIRLEYWILEKSYIDSLSIPKTKTEIEKLFGEANEDDNGEDILWYWKELWYIHFIFKNGQMIKIICFADSD